MTDPMITGWEWYLLHLFGSPGYASTMATVRKATESKVCLVPNPEKPDEKCLNMKGHESAQHSWWYCTSEFGDYPSLDCERQRGHDGSHEGHWE